MRVCDAQNGSNTRGGSMPPRKRHAKHLIKKKTELEMAREKLALAQTDLFAYRKYAGQSPWIDANIRHKAEQVAELEKEVKALEKADFEANGEQVSML